MTVIGCRFICCTPDTVSGHMSLQFIQLINNTMKKKMITTATTSLTMVLFMILNGFFQSCEKVTQTQLPPIEDEEIENWIPGRQDAFVWVDAAANVFQGPGRFRDKDDIKLVLDSLKIVGVNGLIIDVKHNSGFTLYESAYTSKLSSLNGYNALLDYVDFMISEAREREMKIYFSMNTFVNGNTSSSTGYVYENPTFKQYESVVINTSNQRVPISTTGRNSFLNPAIPEVQDLSINIIKEAAT